MGPALSLYPIIICAPQNSVLACFSSHLLPSSSSHTHELQTKMAICLLAFSYGMSRGARQTSIHCLSDLRKITYAYWAFVFFLAKWASKYLLYTILLRLNDLMNDTYSIQGLLNISPLHPGICSPPSCSNLYFGQSFRLLYTLHRQ